MKFVYLIHFKAIEAPPAAVKMLLNYKEKGVAFELSPDSWLLACNAETHKVVHNLEQLVSAKNEGFFVAPLLRELGPMRIVRYPGLPDWFEALEKRDR